MNRAAQKQSLSLWMGLRFLKSRRQTQSFNLAATVSILGLAIGVAALTITLGIMTGFDREYKRSLSSLLPHAVIQAPGINRDDPELVRQLRGVKEVVAVHRYVHGEGILANHGKIKGTFVNGIENTEGGTVSELSHYLDAPLKRGVPIASILPSGYSDHAVLGATLARELGLQVGDHFHLIILREKLRPVLYPLYVSGIFTSGMYEFDSRFSFVSLETAQRIFSLESDESNGIEVAIQNPDEIERVSSYLKTLIHYPQGLYQWKELNANLIAAVKFERIVFFSLVTPIIVVGALTIVAALIMFLMEKRKSIAVLKSMGMTHRALSQIFLTQGLLIGLVGTLTGLGLGTLINFLLGHFPIIPISPQVYYLDHLPISIRALDYVIIFVTALGICFLGILIPVWQASTLKPAEGIRG